MPLIVGYFPLLQCHPRVSGVPLIPPIYSPGYQLCQQHWWLVPSLFLIIFSFWCFFLKSLLLTFHFGVSLNSWPLALLPSRPLTFFRLSFWLPFLLSFVLSELIPSCWVDSLPNYFPSWFFILGSPRYQPLVHELLVSKLSSSLIGMYLFSFLVFLGTPFELS